MNEDSSVLRVSKVVFRELTTALRRGLAVLKRPLFSRKKYCPVCGVGTNAFRQPYTMCPNCFSNPRHRFFWLYFEDNLPSLCKKREEAKVLHFAPEYYSKKLAKLFGDGYYPCDIRQVRAKYVVDITNISYPENFFDCIICSHVLEHRDISKEDMRGQAFVGQSALKRGLVDEICDKNSAYKKLCILTRP